VSGVATIAPEDDWTVEYCEALGLACAKVVGFPVEISLSPVEIRGKALAWSAIRNISDPERSVSQLLVELQNKGLILGGLVSICAWCKRMRDEGGSWLQLANA
jgi:hypothetical protein